MTWRSFVDYLLMHDMGQTDAVFRTYAVESFNGSDPYVLLDRAFERMGFDPADTSLIVPAVCQRLRNMGYRPNRATVETRMRQWYHWDRIRGGDLRSFPRKRSAGPLPVV